MNRKTIIGATALLGAGVCIAYLAKANEHSTWLMLIAGAFFTYVFIKCFSTKELENSIKDRLGRRITPVTILMLILAQLTMPSSMGSLVPEAFHGILYFISYVIWICGLYFLTIKNEV